MCGHPVSSAISDKEPGSLAFNCGKDTSIKASLFKNFLH